MSSPVPGKMAWRQALTGPLAGVTCLWQDLDGLHVEAAPDSPPPTSILWGWRDPAYLVRVRLDGQTAFIAVHDASGTDAAASSGSQTLPWSTGDHRVAASHGPAAQDGGVGAVYEQITVAGIGDGTGPITFLRPAGTRGAGSPEGGHARR
jgi:hypothetical protein